MSVQFCTVFASPKNGIGIFTFLLHCCPTDMPSAGTRARLLSIKALAIVSPICFCMSLITSAALGSFLAISAHISSKPVTFLTFPSAPIVIVSLTFSIGLSALASGLSCLLLGSAES